MHGKGPGHIFRQLMKLGGMVVLVAAGVYTVDRLAYTPTMDGIDVSHHNVDHGFIMPEPEPRFIIAKATEGSVMRDRNFIELRRIARFADAMFGAYHFLSTATPASIQFANYVETVGDNIDIIPILDVEKHAGMRNLSRKEMRALVREWSRLCKERYGEYPIIYCTDLYRIRYFLDFPNKFWICNLWTKPLTPAVIHQYTHNGNTLDYDHLLVPLSDILL